MSKFAYVVFDLDGTLLNTLEDLADACNRVCALHGWPAHPLEEYRRFVGNGAAKLLERVAPPDVELTGALREQTMEEFTSYYNRHSANKTTPYPGLPGLLARLKAAGIKLAVLTNKPDAAAGPVVERYYPGLFNAVQGALPGVPLKPDPSALFHLMERIGAAREHTLFVGDSNVDIQTAKNAGLKGCGVLWGFRTRQELEGEGADFLAEDAGELENVIFSRKTVLSTPRLLLREMEDGDFAALCGMLQDPEVMYAYEGPFSQEEAWDWLRRQQERYRKDGFGLWAAVERVSGEMVGQCGLTWQACGRDAPVLEVGYLLQKRVWGRGYATELAQACRDYAFETLGAEEVFSIVRDSNLPSQAVARRNGMELRGTFVKHYRGVEMPHRIFSVRRKA